jgi:diguanylate cyclase (GGDEF)-like protein
VEDPNFIFKAPRPRHMLKRLRTFLRTLRSGHGIRAQAAATAPIEVVRADDTLTGLLQYQAFIMMMKAQRRSGVRSVLAMLDLDQFERLNDQHGHDVGDEVLRILAVRLRKVAPREVILARFGGDEFGALLAGDLEQGKRLAELLLEEVRRPMTLGGGVELSISASAGVAPVPATGHVGEALRAADAALYAAKHRGRDQCMVFDEHVSGVIGARRELAAAVSVLQEQNRQLQHLVQTDALTGLRNRHALDQVLPLLVGAGGDSVSWQHCSVAFLDIDHFGDYNHLHGDAQGDHVLRQVAETVRTAARRSDMVFRKGGEEIVVVLPDTAPEDARHAAERMRQAVQALAIAHAGSGVAPVITVTVGIAAARSDLPSTIQQLMESAADLAMQAKVDNRRNCVHAI